MIVLSGLVSAGEWLALTLAGIIPYHIHVVANIGPQPLYTAISASMAICAIAIFHSLRVYTPRAFRHPLRPLIHMAWAWTILVLAVITATFLPQGGSIRFARLDGRLVRFGNRAPRHAPARSLPESSPRSRARGAFSAAWSWSAAVNSRGQALRNLRRADPMEIRVLGVFDDRGDVALAGLRRRLPEARRRSTISSTSRGCSRIDLVVFACRSPLNSAF